MIVVEETDEITFSPGAEVTRGTTTLTMEQLQSAYNDLRYITNDPFTLKGSSGVWNIKETVECVWLDGHVYDAGDVVCIHCKKYKKDIEA